ncbi:MBOAT, membrane-bound O-acyltransferase family-domain-containing protein [Phycomyces nitens]|nr:MBOAT, membrane-bound O-acyltransferase family-domain-containing protein [Phycomyces nitens]
MFFITEALSWATGVPEPTLRLLTTLMLAYPVANLYNKLYVRPLLNNQAVKTSESDRNNFILLSGLALAFYYNGKAIYHSLVTVAVTYAICYLGDHFQDRRLATAGVWVFNTVYLLLGYYFTSSDDYDISWTMTQCILCLRLMGFSFDFQDGATVNSEEPKTGNPLPLSFSNDTPLKELPEFAQVLAYSFFPSAFLVGPQFSFSLYKRWLKAPYNGKPVSEWEETQKAQTMYMYRCVGLAIVYLAVQQIIGSKYSTSYLLTDDYVALPLYKRLFVFWMAGRFTFNKYIGVWMLTEGASTLFGISYDGEDKDGQPRFDGLANALPAVYETTTTIDNVIASFNINTNLWSKYYVFKRLRFLGNKNISQFATLGFLAIWHGFHIMYFITFALEFLYIQCELVLRKRLMPSIKPLTSRNDIYKVIWKIVGWLTCTSTTGYAVVGFDLLKVGKAWTAYKNVYFIGHLAIVVILGANALLGKPSRPVTKKII